MTRKQAAYAVSELAKRANGTALKLYLNGGSVLTGSVEYDDDSALLIVDGGRAYVRAEQCAAIEVS
jgi:hypothetical protein